RPPGRHVRRRAGRRAGRRTGRARHRPRDGLTPPPTFPEELSMTTSPLVENGWYLGAFSDEVGRTLLQRWILNRPVCFYRLSDGSANAIEDRCPHRRYPLSLGRLDGDVIECNYHGYRIDGSGVCVGVAEQPDVPKNA